MDRTRNVSCALTGLIGALVVLAGSAGIGVPEAGAQDSNSTDARVAIVMDASSSMLKQEGTGSRLDAAKTAVNSLLDELPDTATVGMLAYGAVESDAPDNQARGCQDIQTLAPVAPLDKEQLRAAVDRLEARGYTPIGNALRRASEELGDAGQRSVVLVSDGIDTCAPPDPCEVAKELSRDGVDLAVHVIGFKADQQTRDQLQCIADATGGSYRQADDAASLKESLSFLAQRAMVPYKTFGTPFEFASSPQQAPYLGEGLYQTRTVAEALPADARWQDAEKRYFRVAVPAGHVARIVMTPLPNIDATGDNREGLGSVLSTQYLGGECNSWEDSDSQGTSGGAFSAAESLRVSIDPDDGDDCDMDQWAVVAQVSMSQSTSDTQPQDVAVEVSVQFEPILSEAETAAFPPGDPGSFTHNEQELPITSPAPVAGGAGYSSATPIDEGSYADALVPGETKYYAYDLDWGQRPQFTIATGSSVADTADTIAAELASPLRVQLDEARLIFFREPRTVANLSFNRPVNYLNRDANQGGIGYSQAGTHYLAVTMNVPVGDAPRGVEQPFEFAFVRDGTPGPGPQWRPSTQPGPAPSDTPPGDAPTATTTTPTTAGAAAEPSAVSTTAQAEPEDSTPGWLIATIGGGVAVVLLGGVVAWAVLSRRSSSR